MHGEVHEAAEYDNVGHIWRTNAGDGVTKVMYYDIAGNITRKATSVNMPGNDFNDLAIYSSAEDVHEAPQASYLDIKGVDLEETRYDLIGGPRCTWAPPVSTGP